MELCGTVLDSVELCGTVLDSVGQYWIVWAVWNSVGQYWIVWAVGIIFQEQCGCHSEFYLEIM